MGKTLHPAHNGHPALNLFAILFLIATVLTTIWRVGVSYGQFAESAGLLSRISNGWWISILALASFMFWILSIEYAEKHRLSKRVDPDMWFIILFFINLAWLVISFLWMLGYTIWTNWTWILAFLGIGG